MIATSRSPLGPIAVYALGCLIAIVLGPAIAYLILGISGLVAAAILVVIVVVLTRPLFVTAPWAGVMIATLSLGAIFGAVALYFSALPIAASIIEMLKIAGGCKDQEGSWWCALPDLPIPSNTELAALTGLITFAILALNLIWFGKAGMRGVLVVAEDTDSAPSRSIGAILKAAKTRKKITDKEREILIGAIRSGDVVVASSRTPPLSGKPTIVLGTVEADAVEASLAEAFRPPQRAPVPPPDFQGRETLIVEMTEGLLSGRASLITAVRGLGGIGKTVLAATLVKHLRVAFPDGVLWLDANGARPGARLNVLEAAERLIHALDPLADLPSFEAERLALYRTVLSKRRFLVVIDDAADSTLPNALIPPSPSALLVTSRRVFTLPGLKGVELPPLPNKDARALVETILKTGGREHMQEENLAALIERCSGLPLALRAAASFLVENPDWSERAYLEKLRDERTRLDALKPDSDALDVRTILGFSYDRLEEDNALLAERWRILSLIPATFDLHAVASIWGCEVDEARDGLSTLRRRALLEYNPETERHRFHDLMRDLAEEKFKAHAEALNE